MPERVFLLLPTTTYRADAFLEAARRMKVDVVLGSDRCHVLAVDSPQAARGAVPLDFRDPDAAARAIVDLARERPFAAVVPVDDPTTVIAAKAAEALGLQRNPPEAVLAAKDKRKLRAALAGAGLPCPRVRILTLDADPHAAAREVAYPVVLKPAALAASQGVIRANDRDEFVAAFERIARLLRTPEIAVRADPALECIIAEGFIPGVEVALEGLLRGGELRVLALFDKPDPLDGPFFEETIYVTPSRLPAASQAAIADATAAAARVLGLREGPIHAELRVNDRGAWVIEVAARSIGGLCSRTLRFGAGVSLEELILAHALGRDEVLECDVSPLRWPLRGLQREPRPAGVMMIPIPRAGFLRGVAGIEEARAVEGIEEVTVTHALNADLRPLPEGDCYLGFIFARGSSPEVVEAALREAHRRLRFDIATVLPAVDVRERR